MTSPWNRRMLDDLAAQAHEEAEEARTDPDPSVAYAGPVETAEERRADLIEAAFDLTFDGDLIDLL